MRITQARPTTESKPRATSPRYWWRVKYQADDGSIKERRVLARDRGHAIAVFWEKQAESGIVNLPTRESAA